MFLSKGVYTTISRGAVLRSCAPRIIATRSFAIADTYGKKEKVEEDRYMRDLEAKYMEKKKAEMAAQMASSEEKEFAEKIAPVMAEAEVLLQKSGDSVSQEGLEALAHWKLGL